MITRLHSIGMSLIIVSPIAACGVDGENPQLLGENVSGLIESRAGTAQKLPLEAEVANDSAKYSILANCTGSAVHPWYFNGRTYFEGRVTCTTKATIPATVYLQRDDGSYVASYYASQTGKSMAWTYSVPGCSGSTKYITRFFSNGELHYSHWQPACR